MVLVPKAKRLLLGGLLGGLLVLAVALAARAEPVLATYYADFYAGAPTASGELYDPYAYTAAHPYLELGTMLVVSFNGMSVVVRVNDRCYCGLDLSLAAAQAVGLTDVGIAPVDVEVLSTEAVPMLPTPTDTLYEVGEAQEVPGVVPSVEAQPSSPTSLEDVTYPTLP